MRYAIVFAAVLAIAVTTVPAMAADNASDFHALSKMSQGSTITKGLSDQDLASVEGQGLLGGLLDCLCDGGKNLIRLPKIDLKLVVKARLNTNSGYYHY
jgi:hypothetical protein